VQDQYEKLWRCLKCGKEHLDWHVVNRVLGHWVGDQYVAKWCGPIEEETPCK
jgi:hypothetical protein